MFRCWVGFELFFISEPFSFLELLIDIAWLRSPMNQGAPPNFAAYQLPFSQPLGLFSGLNDLLQGHYGRTLADPGYKLVKELNSQKSGGFY